jgi:hypothetical protein
MNRNFVIFSSILFAVVSCGKPKTQGLVPSGSQGGTLLGGNSLNVAEVVTNSTAADLQNFSNPGVLDGLPGAFAFSGGAGFMTATPACVTVQHNGTPQDRDDVYTFDCKSDKGSLTGTVEVKESMSQTGGQFEVIIDLAASDAAGDSRTVKSDLTVVRGTDGSVQISKQMDETTKKGTDTLELIGKATFSLTPDQTGGSVVIDSTLEVVKNGTDEGTFSVTSNGLHFSSCGFDTVSIEIKSPSHDITVTFDGCGQHTVTGN